MPPWLNTLSIGADDVSFHSTVGKQMLKIPVVMSFYSFKLLHSIFK